MNSIERASAECNLLAKLQTMLAHGAIISAVDPGCAIIEEYPDHLVLTNLRINYECVIEENENGS